MGTSITGLRLQWAMAHSWYVGHAVNGLNTVVTVHDAEQGTNLEFTHYNMLRIWAGY